MGKQKVTNWKTEDAETLCRETDGVFKRITKGEKKEEIYVVWGEDKKVHDHLNGRRDLRVMP